MILIKKEIGETLRKFREDAGYTQETFAKAMGARKHGYIGRIERGENAPSLSYIEKWLKKTGKNDFDFFHQILSYYRKDQNLP